MNPAEEPKQRLTITKSELDKLLTRRPHRQQTIWDTKQVGFCVLVSRGPKHKKQGTVTLRACYYLPSRPGVPRYKKIGRYPDGTYTYKDKDGKEHTISCADLEQVRIAVSDLRNNAKHGIDPKRRLLSDAFEQVVGNFIQLHAKKHNRTWAETQRIFDRYVLPEWRDLNVGEITQDHVTALLDKIEQRKIKFVTESGAAKLLGSTTQADAVLAQITKLFNWHATRKTDFRSPIVRGMHRGKPVKERARRRVLSDAELRAMWPLLDGVYGAVIKCALLTAQRFHKVSTMRHSDVKGRMRIDSHMVDGNVVDGFWMSDVWDPTRDDDPENKQVSVVPL